MFCIPFFFKNNDIFAKFVGHLKAQRQAYVPTGFKQISVFLLTVYIYATCPIPTINNLQHPIHHSLIGLTHGITLCFCAVIIKSLITVLNGIEKLFSSAGD